MGLFDKKFCDICGDKIGLLGNRKLEDGNLCKDCARKLSPFFSDRRRSTVDEIKQQLAYREQNRQSLRSFTPDRVLGDDKKFFIDSSKGAFVISRRSQNEWDAENPDIISISAVNSCNLRIDQDEEELYYENANGESVSYNPPRYNYTYTFVLEFNVNNPFFDDFEITLNDEEVQMNTPDYMNLQQLAVNIMSCTAPGKFTAPQMNNMYQGSINNFNQSQPNPYQQSFAPYQQPVPYPQQPNPYQQQYNPYQQATNPYMTQPPMQNQSSAYSNQAPVNPAQNASFAQARHPFNQGNFANNVNWFCPACGNANTGNFCSSCGTRKP